MPITGKYQSYSIRSVLAAFSALALAGCGGSGGSAPAPLPSPTTRSFDTLTASVRGTVHSKNTSTPFGVSVTSAYADGFTTLVQDLPTDSSPLADTLIAYSARDSRGYYQIFTVPSGGGISKQVTSAAGHTGAPSWSPDGKIGFSMLTNDGLHQLFSISLDGSQLTQLTFDPTDKFTPLWSSDGTRIAYLAASSPSSADQIYVMPAQGGTATQITHDDLNKLDLTWSPDGNTFAFKATASGTFEIFTAAASDGAIKQLTTGNDEDTPAWSPDGKTIAYTDFSRLALMRADGSTPSLLDIVPGIDALRLAWSPDGKWIAFSVSTGEISVVSSQGGVTKPIIFPNDQADYPAWSPHLGKVSPPVHNSLVGPDGIFGKEIAGFLYDTANDSIQSIVAFDTIPGTPESRQKVTISQADNYGYTVSCPDGLTHVAYINYIKPWVPGPIQTPTLPGRVFAIKINIDPNTGLVTGITASP